MNKSKESVYDGFLTKYKHLPEIFIYRTIENASSLGNAFDIFEDIQEIKSFMYWDEDKNWKVDKISFD